LQTFIVVTLFSLCDRLNLYSPLRIYNQSIILLRATTSTIADVKDMSRRSAPRGAFQRSHKF